MIERIETSSRMSKIVKHNEVVYLCGQVGGDRSVTEKTKDCLARVDAQLVKVGSSRKDILQAIIWVTNMHDLADKNAVCDAWVPKGYALAKACG